MGSRGVAGCGDADVVDGAGSSAVAELTVNASECTITDAASDTSSDTDDVKNPGMFTIRHADKHFHGGFWSKGDVATTK